MMAFLPWHLAFVPSKNVQHQRPSGLAPTMTKFQACSSQNDFEGKLALTFEKS